MPSPGIRLLAPLGQQVSQRRREDFAVAVLRQFAAVEEISVLGRSPPPDWREEVVAVVVLKAGMRATSSELDQWCLHRIARFSSGRKPICLSKN